MEQSNEFKSIDEKWATIYAGFVGDESIYARHMKKKEETKQWRRAAAQLMGERQPVPPRPTRVKGVPWRRFKR